MDLSSSLPWLLEKEDPELMDQVDMGFLYEFTTQNLAPALGEDIQQSFSSMNTSSSASLFPNSHSTTNVASMEISQPRPQQMPKNYTSNPQSVSDPETSSILKALSLNKSNFSTSPQDPNDDLLGTMNQMDDALLLKNISSLFDVFISQGSPCLNQDLATEAGKSKKKKSSTIRDHIIESMVIVNRSQLLAKDDDSSTIENFISSSEKQLLEILKLESLTQTF